jgi:predicted enzyme related to lactoylglutathione lyase
MAQNIKVIVYPVTDTEKAKAFFNKFFGVKPYTDSPYYIGYKVGDIEVGLDPNSKVGPIAYTDVTNIQMTLKGMTDAGATIMQDPKDVGEGLLIAQVKDGDGNVLGFRQMPKK